MVWKAYYRHECPESGDVTEESVPHMYDPPVCDDCGEEYELTAD